MQLLHVLKSKNSPKGQVAVSTKTFAPSLKLMLLFHTETLLLDYPKYLKASLIEKTATSANDNDHCLCYIHSPFWAKYRC